eukprot:6439005-Amphidinium_carterae.1
MDSRNKVFNAGLGTLELHGAFNRPQQGRSDADSWFTMVGRTRCSSIGQLIMLVRHARTSRFWHPIRRFGRPFVLCRA